MKRRLFTLLLGVFPFAKAKQIEKDYVKPALWYRDPDVDDGLPKKHGWISGDKDTPPGMMTVIHTLSRVDGSVIEQTRRDIAPCIDYEDALKFVHEKGVAEHRFFDEWNRSHGFEK